MSNVQVVGLQLLIVVACSYGRGEEPPAILPAGLIAPKSRNEVEPLVRIDHPNVAGGRSVKIACEIRAVGSTRHLYNAFLDGRYRLPGRVTIVSADGKFRRELISRTEIGHEKRATNFVVLGESRSIGREFILRTASAPRPTGDSGEVAIAPGEYYVQAVYNHWLSAAPAPFSVLGRPPQSDDPPQPSPGMTMAQMDEAAIVSEPVKLVVDAELASPENAEHNADEPVHVELRPASVRTKFGREAEVQLRVVNRSSRFVEIYDPMLEPLLGRPPVTLALLTEDRAYLGDLLLRREGSSRGRGAADWLVFPPGGFVSTSLKFEAGYMPTLEGRLELKPGAYVLEARMFSHGVTGRPWDFARVEQAAAVKLLKQAFGADAEVKTQYDDEAASSTPKGLSYEEWQRSFPGPEICRSNRVELEILPRTGD
jgi:hypothetical protein